MKAARGKDLPVGKQTSWSTKRQSFAHVPIECLLVTYDDEKPPEPPARRVPPPPPPPPPRAEVGLDCCLAQQGMAGSSQEPQEPLPASSQEFREPLPAFTHEPQELPLAHKDGPAARPIAGPARRPDWLQVAAESSQGTQDTMEPEDLSYIAHASPVSDASWSSESPASTEVSV